MHLLRIGIVSGSLLLAQAVSASAAGLPTRVGECVMTTIASIETRLEDGVTQKPIAGSGSAVSFANGGYQVSYDTVAEVDQSRKGDPARMCLVSLPTDCPKGDDRGKIYRTTNLRTNKSWELPDSEHACGGA